MAERDFDNFDQFAKDYRPTLDRAVKMSGAEGSYFCRHKVEQVRRREPGDFNGRILDFGCGDGASLSEFKELFPGCQLFGTDVSELSIEIAADMHPDALVTPYDGEKLPYDENSFDIVFTSMVFHHIEFALHSRLMAEISRVLKPGGRFYIFEHNPLNPLTRKVVRECPFDEDAVLLPHGYTRRLIQECGFRGSKLTFALFFPRHKWLRWLLPLEDYLGWCPLGAQYFVRTLK